MKKVISVLLCAAMLLSLAACAEEHVHTFADTWQSDETHHYHQATCEHTDQVSGKEAHFDEDGDDTCDVCGTRMPHTHTYKEEWSFNAELHYHQPSCGCNVTKPENWSDKAAHADSNNDSACDVCGYDYGHTHTYEEDWTAAEGGHWHLPTCGHDVDGSELTAHVDEKLHDGTAGQDGKCDICGGKTHDHTYEEIWTTENGFHFKKPTCGCTIEPAERGGCLDDDENQLCDVCGASVTHIHQYASDWSSDSQHHWHAATCEGDECEGLYDTKIEHDGYDVDGICDTCGYVVFHLYEVGVSAPEYVLIVDSQGNPMTLPLVKEGKKLEFYVAIPDYAKLERVELGNVDLSQAIGPIEKDGDQYWLYKITVQPTQNTVVVCIVNKLSSVEIVKQEKFTLETEGKYKRATYDITFTPEEDGHYALMVIDNEWVRVGEPGNLPYGQKYFIFEGEAGKEVPLQLSYGEMAKETIELTYYIVRVEETFVLPYLEGDGYTMPGRLPITITFSVPEPGLYLFTTQVGAVVWDTPDSVDGTIEPQYFEATEAGQTFTATFRLSEINSVTYEFDWKIVNVNGTPDGELQMGENNVDIKLNQSVFYSFTAPYDGNFSFSSAQELVAINAYYDYYGTGEKGLYAYSSGTMKKGESITLILSGNPYSQNPPTSDFTGVVKVEFKPSFINGNPQLLPESNWTYVADATGDVTFSVPAGCEISIDGGKTWSSEPITLWVEEDDEYVLQARGKDGLILVTIDMVVYTMNLDVGTNAYTFVPEKSYTCKINGAVAAGGSYVLEWDDPDLVIVLNGRLVANGSTIENFGTRSNLIIEYGGSAAEVTITITNVTETVEPEA